MEDNRKTMDYIFGKIGELEGFRDAALKDFITTDENFNAIRKGFTNQNKLNKKLIVLSSLAVFWGVYNSTRIKRLEREAKGAK